MTFNVQYPANTSPDITEPYGLDQRSESHEHILTNRILQSRIV